MDRADHARIFPEQLARFADSDEGQAVHSDAKPSGTIRTAPLWIVAGLVVIVAVKWFTLDKPVYLLGGGLSAFGLAQIVSVMLVRAGKGAMRSARSWPTCRPCRRP